VIVGAKGAARKAWSSNVPVQKKKIEAFKREADGDSGARKKETKQGEGRVSVMIQRGSTRGKGLLSGGAFEREKRMGESVLTIR